MALPPNMMGTGELPAELESRLEAEGVTYAYYAQSAFQTQPVLVTFHPTPEQVLASTAEFFAKFPNAFAGAPPERITA